MVLNSSYFLSKGESNMNKKIILLSALAFAAFASNAQANFGFGFSIPFGNDCCAPAPAMHVGFAAPFVECGPHVGFGFTMPLGRRRNRRHVRHVVVEPAPVIVEEEIIHVPARPVTIVRTVHVTKEQCLDNKNCSYWKIHNATDSTIKAFNCNDECVRIAPHESAKLSHADGFDLTIRFKGSEKHVAHVHPEKHNLTVLFDEGITVA